MFMSWLCSKFGHRAEIDYHSPGGGNPEICKRCGRLLSTMLSRGRVIDEFLASLYRKDAFARARYTEGDCYKLHLMIKEKVPEAQPWYDTHEGHVVTLFDDRFWDITGVKWYFGEQPAYVLPWDQLQPRVREDAPNWHYKE